MVTIDLIMDYIRIIMVTLYLIMDYIRIITVTLYLIMYHIRIIIVTHSYPLFDHIICNTFPNTDS